MARRAVVAEVKQDTGKKPLRDMSAEETKEEMLAYVKAEIEADTDLSWDRFSKGDARRRIGDFARTRGGEFTEEQIAEYAEYVKSQAAKDIAAAGKDPSEFYSAFDPDPSGEAEADASTDTSTDAFGQDGDTGEDTEKGQEKNSGEGIDNRKRMRYNDMQAMQYASGNEPIERAKMLGEIYDRIMAKDYANDEELGALLGTLLANRKNEAKETRGVYDIATYLASSARGTIGGQRLARSFEKEAERQARLTEKLASLKSTVNERANESMRKAIDGDKPAQDAGDGKGEPVNEAADAGDKASRKPASLMGLVIGIPALSLMALKNKLQDVYDRKRERIESGAQAPTAEETRERYFEMASDEDAGTAKDLAQIFEDDGYRKFAATGMHAAGNAKAAGDGYGDTHIMAEAGHDKDTETGEKPVQDIRDDENDGTGHDHEQEAAAADYGNDTYFDTGYAYGAYDDYPNPDGDHEELDDNPDNENEGPGSGNESGGIADEEPEEPEGGNEDDGTASDERDGTEDGNGKYGDDTENDGTADGNEDDAGNGDTSEEAETEENDATGGGNASSGTNPIRTNESDNEQHNERRHIVQDDEQKNWMQEYDRIARAKDDFEGISEDDYEGRHDGRDDDIAMP